MKLSDQAYFPLRDRIRIANPKRRNPIMEYSQVGHWHRDEYGEVVPFALSDKSNAGEWIDNYDIKPDRLRAILADEYGVDTFTELADTLAAAWEVYAEWDLLTLSQKRRAEDGPFVHLIKAVIKLCEV